MGIFDRKDDPPKAKPDFSNVQSGSSSTASAPAAPTGTTGTSTPSGTTGTSSGGTYVVVKGDSLSKIAKREYGDAAKWRRIYEANQDIIKDPDLIYPGQTLKIPGA
jgi:nucleoid-associated protein YgaU